MDVSNRAAGTFVDQGFNRELSLVRYDSIASFLEAAEPFLVLEEARHHLLLGLAYQLLKAGDTGTHSTYLSTVAGPSGIVLAALRIPPQNLVISRCDDADAMRLLAKDIAGVAGSLPGLNSTGDAEGSMFVAKWLQVHPGVPCRIARKEVIYELENVTMPALAPGRFRKAGLGDRELLVDWLDKFQQEGLGIMDKALVEQTVDHRIGLPGELEGTYMWEVEGVPVSMAMASRPTPHGFTIRGVWTPEEYRRLGYARSVVATLCVRILEQGYAACYLYADRAKVASNQIYSDMGFHEVCAAEHWIFEQ
ncbi:MAG: GNAT family N-acetyltransferase [Candidatus Dormibacteria bacterium]